MSANKLDLKKYGILTTQKGVKEGSVIQACDHCEDDDTNQTGNFELDVFKAHLRRRKIIIKGVIDESCLEKVTLQILAFNEEDDAREQELREYDRMHNPISLYISSPGGYVSAGLSIISQITQSVTPVLGYAVGDCSSAAAWILASCHARFSSIYSRIMLHSLSSGYGGKIMDKIDDVEESKRVQKVLDDIITSRTLISQKQLDAMHAKREDWYFSSAEALKYAIIDEVIQPGLKLVPPKKRKKV